MSIILNNIHLHHIYIYIIQILCVCVSVKYRRPNGWTDHDQIWHVYADRPGNGSYQKKMVPRMVRKGGLIGTILRSGYLAGEQSEQWQRAVSQAA